MKRKTTSARHQVRIIGGLWKRSPLAVLDVPGLRPTPDRVRETLFNWLNFMFQNDWSNRRCLDLFAGSGALGFEAASRGAASVTLVEVHAAVARQLGEIRDKLKAGQVQIVQADATTFLARHPRAAEPGVGYDVVFLDPPFHRDWLSAVVPACAALTNPQGLIYIESEQAVDDAELAKILPDWQILRRDRAGQVFFHLLQKTA